MLIKSINISVECIKVESIEDRCIQIAIKDQNITDQCQKQRQKNEEVTLRPFLCQQSLNENSSPSLHKHSRLLILMCLSVCSEAADNETAGENAQPAVVQRRFGDGQINHFEPDSSPVQTAEQTFWLIKRNSTHRWPRSGVKPLRAGPRQSHRLGTLIKMSERPAEGFLQL